MIFIAMPTMHDTELEPTILNALLKAQKPEQLVFGIRYLTSNEEDVQAFKTLQGRYGRKIRGFADLITNTNRLDKIGTGHARKAVSTLYGGERFILSIDSHTLFADNWDFELKKLLRESKEETQNDKTILTAYGARYKYVDGERQFLSNHLYPYMGWEENWNLDMYPFLDRPVWEASLPWMVKDMKEGMPKFLPCPKFAYNFAFSDRMFLRGEDTEVVIMEEDILKTWKLLNQGWELVFPNTEEPIIGHLYLTEIINHANNGAGTRAFYQNFISEEEKAMLLQKEKENVIRYYNDPLLKDTINKYEEWIKAKFMQQSLHNNYIPTEWFQNVGR
jgi:hypothetical protein